MNTNFVTIIKRIIAEQGDDILTSPQRLKGIVADYTAQESKAERLVFGRCIEAGAYNELKAAPDAAARQAVKAALAHRVHSSEGLDITLCNDALAALEAAMYADKKEPPRCASCGKELQPEWKSCPFCGAAAEAKQPETAATQTQFTQTPSAAIQATEPPAVKSAMSASAAPSAQAGAGAGKPAGNKKALIAAVVVVIGAITAFALWSVNKAENEHQAAIAEAAIAEAQRRAEAEYRALVAEVERQAAVAEAERQAAVAEAQRKAEAERQAAVAEAQRKAKLVTYTEMIYVEGFGQLAYTLSNDTSEIEKAISLNEGKSVNLNRLNWFENTVLSPNVKAAMNRLNVNYSYPWWQGIVNKRVGNQWYSAWL